MADRDYADSLDRTLEAMPPPVLTRAEAERRLTDEVMDSLHNTAELAASDAYCDDEFNFDRDRRNAARLSSWRDGVLAALFPAEDVQA